MEKEVQLLTPKRPEVVLRLLEAVFHPNIEIKFRRLSSRFTKPK